VIGRAFHPTAPLRLVPTEPSTQRDDYETAFDEIEEAMNEPHTTNYGWPTTAKFSRTLHGIDSAFKSDPAYAAALIRPSLRSRIVDALYWAIGVAALGFLLMLFVRGGGPFA
jgi:hypothetical protein